MTTFAVYDKFADPIPAVVPDRFSWLAFLLPPVFALAHGLWLELVAWVVFVVALGFAGIAIGAGAAFWIYWTVALLIGFEASALRGGALRRRGFRHRADLVASTGDIAQVQYLRSEGYGQ
jgi:hypothetical protein